MSTSSSASTRTTTSPRSRSASASRNKPAPRTRRKRRPNRPKRAEPEDEEDPTAEPEEEELAVDADEYVATVRGDVETLLASIDEFFALIGDSDFGNDESLDQLSGILTLWAGASSTATSLTPPEGFEDAHELYVEFTDLLLTASTNFLIGISDSDDASITAAGENLREAQTSGQTLLTVLEDA